MAFGLGFGLCFGRGQMAPPEPSAPVLSGGAITQVGTDLIFFAPSAAGYPTPTVTLVSITRDAVDITADLDGSAIIDFEAGAYVATWFAENSEGDDTIVISGSFTPPVVGVQPSFSAGPTISGTPATGETLTVSATAAGTAPITTERRWIRGGVIVEGETGATYALGTVTPLETFQAEVRLTNAYGTTGWTSTDILTAAEPAGPEWIMSAGTWNDAGVWDDAGAWNDGV